MRKTQHPDPQRRRGRGETANLPAPDNATISIEDVDDLLEEIDSLLEDQAVLTNFRQRSGQ
ncbi:MAG: hypothetical protein ACRDZ3_03125 [Acidimicrobiia bacterium]